MAETEIIDEQDPVSQKRAADMIAEGGGVWPSPDAELHAKSERDSGPNEPTSELDAPPGVFSRFIEEASRKWGHDHLRTLAARQGRVSETLGTVPQNMHRVAAQTELILELVDDFRDGTYRKVSWRTVALLVGALLYAVSPADVIPDALPVLGSFDDLAVLALVTRMVRGDLVEYCEFKGYPTDQYFRAKD